MDTFLELNKQKLKSAFVHISLVLLGLVSIFLVIAYMTGNLPGGQILLSIILATGIVFPFFIMLLGYLIWTLNHNARQTTFAQTPFNQVDKIGFYKAYKDDTSKWSFTEVIRESNINGFPLRMDLSKENGSRFIEFAIPVEWKKLNKSEFNRLTEKFKEHNAELRIGSIAKQYDTKQQALQTVFDLRRDLELFTTLLRQEGFEAKS